MVNWSSYLLEDMASLENLLIFFSMQHEREQTTYNTDRHFINMSRIQTQYKLSVYKTSTNIRQPVLKLTTQYGFLLIIS